MIDKQWFGGNGNWSDNNWSDDGGATGGKPPPASGDSAMILGNIINIDQNIVNLHGLDISGLATVNANGYSIELTTLIIAAGSYFYAGSSTITFIDSGVGSVYDKLSFREPLGFVAQTSTLVFNTGGRIYYTNPTSYGTPISFYNIEIVDTSTDGGLVYFKSLVNTQVININSLTLSPGVYVKFFFSDQFNVTNFYAVGTLGNLITLRSDQAVPFHIAATTAAIAYVDVQNSDATGAASPLVNSYGVDSGGNSGWEFITSASLSKSLSPSRSPSKSPSSTSSPSLSESLSASPSPSPAWGIKVGAADKDVKTATGVDLFLDTEELRVNRTFLTGDGKVVTVKNSIIVSISSASLSPSASPSLSSSLSVSLSPSLSESLSPSLSASLSPSITPSASSSLSSSLSPSATVSPSLSESLSPSLSESLSPSQTPSPSLSESLSPSLTPSLSESLSPSLSQSLSESLSPSATTSASLSESLSPSNTPSPSLSKSLSPSKSPSLSSSLSPSSSASPSAAEKADFSTKTLGFVEAASGNWGNVTVARLSTLQSTAASSSQTFFGSYITFEVSDFAFGLPADAEIKGIIVNWNAGSGDTTTWTKCALSWNDGANYTDYSAEQGTTNSTWSYKTVGSSTNLWGRGWVKADFDDGNFRLKMAGYTPNGSQACYIDYVEVTIHYTIHGSASPSPSLSPSLSPSPSV